MYIRHVQRIKNVLFCKGQRTWKIRMPLIHVPFICLFYELFFVLNNFEEESVTWDFRFHEHPKSYLLFFHGERQNQ